MKKTIKSITALFAAVALLVSVFCLPTAAATAYIHVTPNKETYAVGEEITIKGTFTDNNIIALNASITYDSSKVAYVSGGTNQGGYVQFVESYDDFKGSVAVSATFKVIAEGSAYFRFSAEASNGISKSSKDSGTTLKLVTPAVSSVVSSVASNNANLKSLSISGAKLSPAFSKNTTGYTATVANSVEKVTVKATAADSGAKVEGAGTYPLDVGNNKISVTVTAADGQTRKEYAVNVKRNAPDEEIAGQAPTESEENSLNVSVNGKEYTVIADISALAVPTGFTATTTLYGEVEVGCLTEASGSYKLYWLNDESSQQPTLFRYTEDGEFERLIYTEIAGKFYIFIRPERGLVAPDGFYETTLSFDSGNATAYAYSYSKMADFYIVYCWCDGAERFYRYDKLENTLQREPDFGLVKAVDASTEVKKDNVLDWFFSLSKVAKSVIIVALCTVIVLILLIIFVVLMIKNRHGASPVPMLGDDFFSSDGDGFTFETEETEVLNETEFFEEPKPQTETENDIGEDEE